MKVVTCYKASQIAGVSKQAIQSLKNVNTLQKGKYPFFCFDPITGKFGIDIENKEWVNYLDRNRNNPARRKKIEEHTKGEVITNQSEKTNANDNIIKAVVMAVKEKFDLNGKELKDLLRLIDKKHDEIRGEK